MLNYNNWKSSCLNYWKSMNSCPAILAQPFMKLGECLPGSSFTLICSSYAVYKITRCLDILFPGRGYENDLSTQYHRMGSLPHNEASFLNFQYWQKVLYFSTTHRLPEIHIVAYKNNY